MLITAITIRRGRFLPFRKLDKPIDTTGLYIGGKHKQNKYYNRFDNRLYRVYKHFLSNRLDNRFDNRLYRVNGALQ